MVSSNVEVAAPEAAARGERGDPGARGQLRVGPGGEQHPDRADVVVLGRDADCRGRAGDAGGG